ncbi:MAG: hypothetical protein AAGA19_08975 [Pseudomonadota bacterium]
MADPFDGNAAGRFPASNKGFEIVRNWIIELLVAIGRASRGPEPKPVPVRVNPRREPRQ